MTTFLMVLLGIVILYISRSLLLGIYKIIIIKFNLPISWEYQLIGLLISSSLIIGGDYIFDLIGVPYKLGIIASVILFSIWADYRTYSVIGDRKWFNLMVGESVGLLSFALVI
jgi:hypothetical protein